MSVEDYFQKHFADLWKDEEGSLAELVGNAHQLILNAPVEKEDSLREAMRLLEIAYLRVVGRPSS